MLGPCTRSQSVGQGLSYPVPRVHRRWDLPNLNVGNDTCPIDHGRSSGPAIVASAGLRRRRRLEATIVAREPLCSRHSAIPNHKSVRSKPHMIRGWPPWPAISSIGALNY
jgi:hypothetical protein